MQRSRLIACLAAAMLLAGCSGFGGGAGESPPIPTSDLPSEPVGSEVTTAPTEPAPAESTSTALTSEPAIVDAPTEAETAAPTELALAPGQRSAPIAIDAGFHNDEARVVAASGRPQLIEIFTFW